MDAEITGRTDGKPLKTACARDSRLASDSRPASDSRRASDSRLASDQLSGTPDSSGHAAVPAGWSEGELGDCERRQ